MFASEHWGLEPDIVCAAKGIASGMPLGAMIARAEISTWPPSSHGSTFGGNPVACAAALATLDLIENGLMQNAARVGAVLLDGLRALARKHDIIGDVRGIGLMLGVEFVADKRTKEPLHQIVHEIELAAFRKGLLLLGCGQSTIRLAPPLVVDEEDAAIGLRILDEVLAELRVPA